MGKQGSTRALHLDVVRGVAILLVLLRHVPILAPTVAWLDPALRFFNRVGWVGVDLFFVLSGFLIGGLLFREYEETGTVRLARFWARRALKIWPAYLFFLGSYFLFRAFLAPRLGWQRQSEDIWDMLGKHWSNLLHVQNYDRGGGPDLLYTWSLAVEEHFYLIFPPLLLLLARRRAPGGARSGPGRVLALLVAGAVACFGLRAITRCVVPEFDIWTYRVPTHLCFDELLTGVCLAYFARFAPQRLAALRPLRWLLLPFGVALLSLPAMRSEGQEGFLYPLGPTLILLGSTSIVLFAHLTAGATRAAPATVGAALLAVAGAVAAVGRWSYSIYLWHVYFGAPVAVRLMRLLGFPVGESGWPVLAHVALYGVACVALGWLATYAVEAPVLKLRDRLLPARPRDPHPAAEAGAPTGDRACATT